MPVTWQFFSPSLCDPLCRVLAFTGEDALQQGYSFDILLMAPGLAAKDARDIPEKLLNAPLITLTGRLGVGESFSLHGMAASASYLFSRKNDSVFRVTLRPRSYRLWLSVHSRIFLHMPLPRILTWVLKEEGFSPDEDFDLALRENYPGRPYTCQYNERPAGFLLRHLEHVGAYAYHRQTESGDVLVLADGAFEPEKLPLRDNFTLSEYRTDETVFSLFHIKSAAPARVTLRDYSAGSPGVTAASAGNAQGPHGGREINQYAACNIYGQAHASGKNVFAKEAAAEAARLAALRLRAQKAKAGRAEGESSVPWLRAGYAVTLDGEPFQILFVRHACNLAGSEEEDNLVRRARHAGFSPGTVFGYRNFFVCHPLACGPYAPECESLRPSIPGLLPARLEASGKSEYAEADKHGRYNVVFFFPEKVFHADADAPSEGQCSIPLHVARSLAGQPPSVHFPLPRDAELLAAFIDGDPDRPVILGALPGQEHSGAAADENQQAVMSQALMDEGPG